MQFSLQHMDAILRRHVAGTEAAAQKARKTKSGIDRPDSWPAWRKHQPYVKSYLFFLLQFLGQLAEAPMIVVTLQQVGLAIRRPQPPTAGHHRGCDAPMPCMRRPVMRDVPNAPCPIPYAWQVYRLLPFYYCLPKLCPKLLKAVVAIWSASKDKGGSQQTTLLAFAIVRELATQLPYPFIE